MPPPEWTRDVLICERCDELEDACGCPSHLAHFVAVRVVKIPSRAPDQRPGSCSNCNRQAVGTGHPYWEEVVGWTQRRAQGGANHVADRKPTGRIMCEACMHLERSPVAEVLF